MHQSVLEFVEHAVETYGLAPGRTLEIGSRNINGSVRQFFTGEYVGVDHQAGEGVDLQTDAAWLPYDDAWFDTVVSTSMLEHDPHFWLTLREVARVLRPGGYLVLTTVTNSFHEHDNPDYWRFMHDAWPVLMELAWCELVESRDDPQSGGPQLVGRRR